MDKLDDIVKYLIDESGTDEFSYLDGDMKSKYRALVNVRNPKPISEVFLNDEDEYLQEELKKQNIVNVSNLKSIAEEYPESSITNKDKICLWQGDITKLKIDAIVNAGNSQGLGCFLPNHNCIDNQINTFAGVRLRLACNEIMKGLNYNLETGNAIITPGFNLPAKFVIQTVGPIINYEVTDKEKEELANCYKNSLDLAIKNGIRAIAFPCISTGVFRFPKDLASQIALKTVDDFISSNANFIDKVVFNVYSDEDVMVYEQNIRKY